MERDYRSYLPSPQPPGRGGSEALSPWDVRMTLPADVSRGSSGGGGGGGRTYQESEEVVMAGPQGFQRDMRQVPQQRR